METTKQTRKSYAPNGERSQVRQTLLIDNEHAEWLASKSNKSRYINDLITRDRGTTYSAALLYAVRRQNGKDAPKIIATFHQITDAMNFIRSYEHIYREGVPIENWPSSFRDDGRTIRLEVVDTGHLPHGITAESPQAEPIAKSSYLYEL